MLRDRPLQGGGVGGGAVDHADLEVEDRAYQQLAVSRAEGDHGGTCGLEGEMVAHAAHPHPVVEAVDRECAGGEPGSLEAARADRGRLRRVGLGLGDVHGLAGRARGAVQADDELAHCREIVAEGRMCRLGLAQHRLVAEGKRRQVLKSLRHRAAGPEPGEEGRLRDDVGRWVRQRSCCNAAVSSGGRSASLRRLMRCAPRPGPCPRPAQAISACASSTSG